MIAYFNALSRDDMPALIRAYHALSGREWLLVCLCFGGIGEGQYGFRTEVGCA